MQVLAHTIKTDCHFVLSYSKSGKLEYVKLKKGKMQPKLWDKIGKILPPTFEDLTSFKETLKGTVSYTEVVKEKNLFTEFNTIWFAFYENYTGFPPKFTGIDGKSLKQIITYLQSVCTTEEESLQVWQNLLNNWHKLDKFHQKNTDLKYINSQLNKLLQDAKQSNSGSKIKYSDNFQRKIIESLQS
ncbi:hypothetical protein ACIPCA_12615 [Flavobacterium covae]|uniref:Uncharacterized protein n=1 Tax=Flavobacterium davisii TaxID=2906077 RepID=A0A246GF11_9FLAO|nr:hypothetical protein [Flavobacterium davisii]OWP82695.1 hypothetical protein BWK59_14490 [Flavobacterium davisii]